MEEPLGPGYRGGMIRIGRYNELEVTREVPAGVLLGDEELFLPHREVPDGTEVGQVIRVFVYSDSEGQPLVTTAEPAGEVGELVVLRCVDTHDHGAFMAWGLGKDLLVPWNLQHVPLEVGDVAVTALFLDQRDRITGSTKLAGYLDRDVNRFRPGQEVDLLVYGEHDRGTQVIVDGRYAGLLFDNETFRPLAMGDRLRGWVKQARPDGKLDVSLQPPGRAAIDSAQEMVLAALRDNEGFLPLHDRSPPEAIQRALRMSKKRFKKAIGGLYKQRLIQLEDEGIRLV